MNSKNVRLLADNNTKAGFYCYIPDVVQRGDRLPIEFLQSVEPPLRVREQQSMIGKTKATGTAGFGFATSGCLNTAKAFSKPLISSFIPAAKAIPGTGRIGTFGFCWGARYAILTAHGKVDAAYACHPSLVAIPGDFGPVMKPLGLAVGTKDSLLDTDSIGKI